MNDVLPVAPPAVRWITRTLEEAGHETWAVGGAVRDALLGRPSEDWDLATHARPKTVRSLFRRTVPIGIEHGTVGVLSRDGTLYEVTTFRKDVETDGRHAVVAFAETIADDLGRRDFTINAIAWHVVREELFDPFDGVADLRDGILRTVGEAEDRFSEDHLRILRALRFAGRFGLEIEEGTWRGARALVERLTELSPERVREELLKVLSDEHDPTRTLELYADSGALAVLYPELERTRSENPVGWCATLAAVEFLPKGRPDWRLAALLRPLPADEVARVLLRLRLSNARMDEVARLASAPPLPSDASTDADIRRWLSANGPQRLNALARLDLAFARAAWSDAGPSAGDRVEGPSSTLHAPARPESVVDAWCRARAIRRSRPPLSVSDLELDGRALISLGMKPGPHFGDVLEGLLAWVLEEPSRNERPLLEARALELAQALRGAAPGHWNG